MLCAFAEAAEHRFERADERRQVVEQVATDDLRERSRYYPHRDRDDLQVGLAARLRRGGQQPHHPPVQESAEPVRRVQEVQRRARRRRVDDDQVPLVGGDELSKLFHRHVLLRACERGGQRLVEGVGEDLFGALGGGVFEHDVVERPLHVEHHREEPVVRDALDHARGVVQLLQPHRLGQPPGRVDGQHHGAPARAGGDDSHRRRSGGLAHAAAAARDDDPRLGIANERPDVQSGRAHGATPCRKQAARSRSSPSSMGGLRSGSSTRGSSRLSSRAAFSSCRRCRCA